jgi:hypothetical protein
MNMPWQKPATAAPIAPPPFRPNPSAPVPKVEAETIAQKIDRLAHLRNEIKGLEKIEETLAEEIKKLGEGEHKGGHCIAVVQIIPTDRFDSKAFKAEHPDFHAKFVKPSPQTKITIKPLV